MTIASTTTPTTPISYQATIAPTRFVETADTRYAYRRFGKAGGKPLIFLQRFRGTMDDWDPAFLEPLAADRELILFDNAGIGRSDGEAAHSLQAFAANAATFIEALELQRRGKIDVLGFSFGGYVAQQLALDRPDLVASLVIAGSGPGYVENSPATPDKVWQVAAKPVNDDEDFLYLFFQDSPASRAAGLAHLARLKLRADAFQAPVSAKGIGAQLASAKSVGTPETSLMRRLKELRIPVLVANGMDDIMIPTYKSYVMARELPNARLVLYPDAGHGFLFQYAKEFAQEVLRFLSSGAQA